MGFSTVLGDVDKVQVVVETTTEKLDTAWKEVTQLNTALEKIHKTIAKLQAQGNKGLVASWQNNQEKQTLEAIAAKHKEIIALSQKLTREQRAQNELAKQNLVIQEKTARTGRQFSFGINDPKKLSEWKKQNASAGLPIVGLPGKPSLAIANMKNLRTSMNDLRLAGIANVGTLESLKTGAEAAFSRGFTMSEKFRLGTGILKKDLDSLFYHLHDHAKKIQWTGRQMMEGVSLPFAALATSAIQSFDSVNKEMLQLKKVSGFVNPAEYQKMRKDIRGITEEYGLTDRVVTGLYTDISAMGIRNTKDMKAWAESISKLSILGGMDMGGATDFFRVINATYAGGDIDKTNKEIAQLNAVADDASLQLKDLAEAIPQVAPVMKEMGFDAAGTGIAIASMYKRGIDATQGAHALKFGMQRLVDPTKKAADVIKELGINFFDANGQFTDADANMAAMAMKIDKLAPEDKNIDIGRMFGTRQASRFGAMFSDMAQGIKELKAANADGKITMAETEKFTSDYARTMVSTGKVAAEGVMDSGEKYKRAWEEFKKDPSIGLARLKATLKNILVDLGGQILPPILTAGQKVADFLKKLNEMPAPVKKIVGAVMAMAAAFGPLIYIVAQSQHVLASFGEVATKILPKGFKDITEGQAHALFKKDPNRKDIGQVGDKFVRFKKSNKKGSLTQEEFEVKATKKAEKELGDEVDKTTKKFSLQALRARHVKEGVEGQRKSFGDRFWQPPTNKNVDMHRENIKAIEAQQQRLRRVRDLRDKQIQDHFRKGKSVTHLIGGHDWDGDIKKLEKTKQSLHGLIAEATTPHKDVKGGIFSILKDFGLSGGKLFGGGNAASGIGGFATKLTSIVPILLKLGGIGVAIGVVAIMAKGLFSTLQEGAEIVLSKVKPVLGELHAAWDMLSTALQGAFKEIMKVVTGEGDEKQQATSFWETLGDVIQNFVHYLSIGIAIAAKVIGKLKPVWEAIGHAIKHVIGFVKSLFAKDWATAFLHLAGFAYEGIRPVIMLFDMLWKAAVSSVQMVIGAFSHLPFMGQLADNFAGMLESFKSKSLTGWMDENLRGINAEKLSGGNSKPNKIFDEDEDNRKKEAEDAGKDDANKYHKGWNDELKKKSKENDWFKDFLSAVKSRLDKAVQDLRDSATKAFDAMQEAEQKYYDDKLKALDDIEKAEEKLYAEQEYLEKKREMLYQRSIDAQNYQRNRALALYEGRVDDARMLDLDEQKSKRDFNKEYSKMEEDHRRDLVKQAREEQRAAIEEEKAALEKRQAIAKEAFEKMLQQITQYTPRTIGEMQNMMNSINSLLEANSVIGWPAMAETGGQRFMEAIRNANEDIRQEFAWSGDAAITAWIAKFADPDVIAILKLKGAEVKDSVDSGLAGIGDDALKDFNDGLGETEKSTKSTMDRIGDILSGGWDDISESFSGFMEDLKIDFFGAIGDLLNGFMQGIAGMVNSVFQVMVKIANAVISSWNLGLFMMSGQSDVIPKFDEDKLLLNPNTRYIAGSDLTDQIKAANKSQREMKKKKEEDNKLRTVSTGAWGFLTGHASGGITSGPYIAGEGNPRYPEWIIPSDPQHRTRAMALVASLMSSIGSVSRLPGSSGAISSGISSVAGAAAESAGTHIYVDTMIGEEEWFNKKMEQWDIKVGKKKANATGSQQRVINKYNDNNRGRWK